MILKRTAKGTLTPFELNIGDKLVFTKVDGNSVEVELLSTSAKVLEHDYAKYNYLQKGDCSSYSFVCRLLINGKEIELTRYVGNQKSFYEPLEICGIRLWFDAVADIFSDRGGFMVEKDWRYGFLCAPFRQARFAIQDSTLSICPEPIHLWYDNPDLVLDINNCYNGENCWMGPYAGAEAHCGLDINMPAGSVLYAPITFDDHYYFNSIEAGANNNRWRGIRRWADGSEWWLQTHHIIKLLKPEHTVLKGGVPYATSAGVNIGKHQHSHFLFKVLEQGGEYFLDPWILFWQMFKDTEIS